MNQGFRMISANFKQASNPECQWDLEQWNHPHWQPWLPSSRAFCNPWEVRANRSLHNVETGSNTMKPHIFLDMIRFNRVDLKKKHRMHPNSYLMHANVCQRHIIFGCQVELHCSFYVHEASNALIRPNNVVHFTLRIPPWPTGGVVSCCTCDP